MGVSLLALLVTLVLLHCRFSRVFVLVVDVKWVLTEILMVLLAVDEISGDALTLSWFVIYEDLTNSFYWVEMHCKLFHSLLSSSV